MARNRSGCRACGTTRSSRFRAYEPVVHDVLFKKKGPTKPSSTVICNSCYASCAAAASISIHKVGLFQYCHNLVYDILYFPCWCQLVLMLLYNSRQLRLMRQPRKVPTRRSSQAATRIQVKLVMEIIFLRFRRCLASKRKDLVDFAVTSASFAE